MVPVLTALGLAWADIADQLVLIIGVLPLALVCVLRVGEAAVRERSWSRGLAARTFELSLIAAAAAAAGLAWVAEPGPARARRLPPEPDPVHVQVPRPPGQSALPVGRTADLRG